jgi:hypothetical protein
MRRTPAVSNDWSKAALLMSGPVTRWTGSFPRLFFCGLSKTDAGATAVLVDELHAGRLHRI